MKDILATLQRCLNQQLRCVIATIVKVEGSAYRREGVRAVILETGEIQGVLSGGCVESDLREHALYVLKTGCAKQLTYDFRGEDDLLWGMGVGCDGAITIWLQPFDPVRRSDIAETIYGYFQRRYDTTKAYEVFTVIDSCSEAIPLATEFIIDDSISLIPSDDGLVQAHLYGETVKGFCEKVVPVPRLVLVGSGPDVVPLINLAQSTGWRITLIDHRGDNLERDAFQSLDEVRHIKRSAYKSIDFPSESFVVVMTHNYEVDRMVIASSLQSNNVSYLGVLGSHRRMQRLINEISDVPGFNPEWTKLFAPIGLEISAESPEEIAISIMSEILMRLRDKLNSSTRFMRERLIDELDTDGQCDMFKPVS